MISVRQNVPTGKNGHSGLVRVLVDSFADKDFTNAQMTNGREIIRQLDPDRFHVSVFTLGEPDPLIAQRPNTRLIPLPQRRQTIPIFREFVTGTHQIVFYLKSSPASKWYLRARRSWRDERATIGMIESRSDLRKEPTIAAEAVRLWERTVLRCDYLFTNSPATQQSLQSEYGLRSDVVPTGVDTAFFSPRPDRAPNRRVRILFVGSLRPFKEPQLLLKAARRFPEADFVIVGDGPLADDLLQRIRIDRLANVALTGALKTHAVREQYRQADIFLFPSRWEGSPRVILEAAGCGLPVIARNNYRPETVISGATGFLAGSDGELFSALQQLICDQKRRQAMGMAGRKHVERFDWGRITRRWEEIFLSLASRPTRHRAR
jgi:glycosyltransferase involved in cell wall biosynthesis